MLLKEKKHAFTIIDLFYLILITVISSWYVLPAVKITVKPIYIAILGLFLILKILIKDVNWHKNLFILFTSLSVVFLLYFLYTYEYNLDKAIGIMTQLFISCLPSIILFSLVQNKNVVKPFFIILCIMVAFVILITVSEMIINPRIVRILAYGQSNEYDLTSYRMRNIGGYGHSYGIAFISVFLIYKICDSKKLNNKKIYVYLILLAFCCWYLIKAEYFLAIIIVAVSIFFIINLKLKMELKVFAIILSVFIILLLPNILSGLSSIITVSSISQKLNEISMLIKNGEISGTSSSARIDVYLESFNQFFKSPIWGSKGGEAMYLVVGGHSTILDFLGQSGLLGLFSYICSLIFINKNINGTFHKLCVQSIEGYKIIFLLYILLSFLNPTMNAYELSFFVFLFIPLAFINTDKISNMVMEERNENVNHSRCSFNAYI